MVFILLIEADSMRLPVGYILLCRKRVCFFNWIISIVSLKSPVKMHINTCETMLPCLGSSLAKKCFILHLNVAFKLYLANSTDLKTKHLLFAHQATGVETSCSLQCTTAISSFPPALLQDIALLQGQHKINN